MKAFRFFLLCSLLLLSLSLLLVRSVDLPARPSQAAFPAENGRTAPVRGAVVPKVIEPDGGGGQSLVSSLPGWPTSSLNGEEDVSETGGGIRVAIGVGGGGDEPASSFSGAATVTAGAGAEAAKPIEFLEPDRSGAGQPEAAAPAPSAPAWPSIKTDNRGVLLAPDFSFTGTPPASDPPTDCFGQAVTIWGTEGDDIINGTPGDDVIHALGGNDSVNGGELKKIVKIIDK